MCCHSFSLVSGFDRIIICSKLSPCLLDNSPSEQEEPATTDGGEDKEAEDCGILEEQVLSMCNVVRENILEFIRNTHGSHVMRTLVHVLAGCVAPARADSRPGK